MSQLPQQPQLLQELAQLPSHDPRRKGLEAQIQSMEPAEREHWLEVLKETDDLYARAASVPLPPGLEEKLLALPHSLPAPLPWWKRMGNVQLGWLPLVACAVITVGVLTWLFWPPPPPGPRLLSNSVAEAIGRQAVREQETQPAMEIASGDGKQVELALAHHAFSFPVMVLKPRMHLDLQGGGVCDFAGTPAVFTRWQGSGLTYTLYQFDGQKLGAPQRFLRTTDVPKDLWHDGMQYRVVIWPGRGQPCTWALVMQTASATDSFSESY